MPRTIAELVSSPSWLDTSKTNLPLAEIYEVEAKRAQARSTGNTPIYAMVNAGSDIDHDGVKRRIAAVKHAKLDGMIFELDAANVAAVRNALREH
jgi:hypothetical protein